MARNGFTVLIAVLLGGAAGAQAQQIPPPEAGDPIVTVATEGNQVELRDAHNGKLILDRRAYPLHGVNGPQTLTPAIEIRPQPAGFDVVYRFTNSTTTPGGVGELGIGILTLGQDVTHYDFRHTSKPVKIKATTWTTTGRWYPDDLYSPVVVLRNNAYAVGVSLHYPILEYKHDAIVYVGSPPGQYLTGEGGRGWSVTFGLSGPSHQEPKHHGAVIPPGEERTYVVSVRVTKKPDEWVRALVPYRDYFRGLYGSVGYTRDAAPWAALNVTDSSWITPSNPSGWAHQSRRPDVNGWGPWVEYVTQDLAEYKRVMIWAPTGLYNLNRDNNYPFQFASRWLEQPNVATAIDPEIGLPAIPRTGQVLGLWWGRAVQVADSWNDAQLDPFNPDNPQHVNRALTELQVAVQSGATVIGLDTFDTTVTPLWKLVPWLETMRQQAPGVKFVTEPSTCDVLHRLAPTLVDNWVATSSAQSPDDLYTIKNPNYLADFILPGHELWASMRWDSWPACFGHHASAARKRQDVQAAAAFGYVPVLFGEVPNPNKFFRAARTWETTVPPSLRNSGGTPPGGNAPAHGPGAPTPPPPPPPAGPSGSSGGSGRDFDAKDIERALRRVRKSLFGF
ncbi:MAG: hypothetical protein ACKVU4_15200 [Phycisphaerales bacterium]